MNKTRINNNNNNNNNNVFSGICKSKSILFNAVLERNSLSSVVTINEQLVP